MAIELLDPKAKKTRLPYIDISKGLLIIFLVFHHIVNMAKGSMSVENMQYITKWDILYVTYFMQAFFFITGYCSSFDKEFRPFLKSNIKALLIPLLFFSIINQSVCWMVNGEDFFFVTELGTKFFFVIELYWFLSALFIAKILLFFITRISQNMVLQFLLVSILFIFAISLNTTHFHSFNWFHWHNGITDLMFLWFGHVFKKKGFLISYFNKLGISAMVMYLIGIIVFMAIGKNVPYYTHFPHFNWKYAPLFIYFSLSGTLMILYIGLLISENKFLSFWGKNTIVVYGIHFSILNIVIILLSMLFVPLNHVQGFVFYCIVGGASLYLSYLTCLLFQKKPFTYLIGKF